MAQRLNIIGAFVLTALLWMGLGGIGHAEAAGGPCGIAKAAVQVAAPAKMRADFAAPSKTRADLEDADGAEVESLAHPSRPTWDDGGHAIAEQAAVNHGTPVSHPAAGSPQPRAPMFWPPHDRPPNAARG